MTFVSLTQHTATKAKPNMQLSFSLLSEIETTWYLESVCQQSSAKKEAVCSQRQIKDFSLVQLMTQCHFHTVRAQK